LPESEEGYQPGRIEICSKETALYPPVWRLNAPGGMKGSMGDGQTAQAH